jgi:polyphosphate kinase
MADVPTLDRELSWLAFNGRVLQEAADPRVPLAERLGFLAIFSSNLDEFFRVRVAALRALLRLKNKHQKGLDLNPAKLLRTIHATVAEQQETFGDIFRGHLLPALERHGIALRDERDLTDEQEAWLLDHFRREVRPHLHPILLGDTAPFLENGRLYLVAELWPRAHEGLRADHPTVALVEVPHRLKRFVEVPDTDPRVVLFLDDVIRLGLPHLFPEYETGDAFAVKLTRDADLNVEDEFSGDLVAKIRKALGRRDQGPPSRFLYDPRMPYGLVTMLKERLHLEDEDLVGGGRYHNFGDLWDFPRPDDPALAYPPLPPLPHPELEGAPRLLDAVAERDHLLHLPYQRYDYVTRLLEEAAAADDVEEVWMSLYRVAKDSALARALIAAAEAGKRVTAFVEVKARFDEENNLDWGERMEAAGVRVLYSMPGMKVHAKLALIGRREDDGLHYTGVFSTGNFNEKTARIYADHVLFTADPRLTDEARRVFAYLAGEDDAPAFEHLLVAPFTLHKGITKRIKREMAHAAEGRPARLTLKMNALEEDAIVARLYEASSAGVDVRMVVRGICRLLPGVPDLSDRVAVRSIVDRFLEHARVWLFHNDGDEELFLASADWMHRNFHRRVEVAVPIYDDALRDELKHLLALQFADDTKARVIDAEQRNAYHRGEPAGVRAQTDTYAYLRERIAEAATEPPA